MKRITYILVVLFVSLAISRVSAQSSSDVENFRKQKNGEKKTEETQKEEKEQPKQEYQKPDVYYENNNPAPQYNSQTPKFTLTKKKVFLQRKNNYDAIIGLSTFNTGHSLTGGGEYVWLEGKGNILDPRKKDGTLMIGAVGYYGNYSGRFENDEVGQYNSIVTDFGFGGIVNRNNVTADMNSWTFSLLAIHSKIRGQSGPYNREQINNDFLANLCITPSAKDQDATFLVKTEISGYYRGNITHNVSSRYDTTKIKGDHMVDTRAWGILGTAVVLKQNLGGFLILSKKFDLEIPLSVGYDYQLENQLKRLVLAAGAWINYQGNQFVQLNLKAFMELNSDSLDNVLAFLEAKFNVLSFLNRF